MINKHMVLSKLIELDIEARKDFYFCLSQNDDKGKEISMLQSVVINKIVEEFRLDKEYSELKNEVFNSEGITVDEWLQAEYDYQKALIISKSIDRKADEYLKDMEILS